MSDDYLSEFDSVIVGLAPPTSTSAHRIYGALSVISRAWDLNNLSIVIDAPDPRRIWAGLNSVHSNPESLVKDFYSKRSEYSKTFDEEVFKKIIDGVDKLFTSRWPNTIYPKLPWMSFASVSSYIPNVDHKNLLGLCFDKEHLSELDPELPVETPKYWVSDAPNTKWSRKQEKTVRLPVIPLKGSRWEYSAVSRERLLQSVGCFVPVHRGGDPWWTPSISQSLRLRVPVVTDWLLSSMLGESWTVLPGIIEDMSPKERLVLSEQQIDSYSSSLLDWEDSVSLLVKSLLD